MPNLKRLAMFALLLPAAASAHVFEVDYIYDGSTMTLAAGSDSLFATDLAVGDTLNLTYSAKGGDSYWDFSAVGLEGNVNLGFDFQTSCGTRASEGTFSALLDGAALLSGHWSVGSQSCIHLGPNTVDFSNVSALDQFTISYTLTFSSAPKNLIASFASNTWWQIWELFEDDAPFVYVPGTDVAEPATLPLLVIGGLGAAWLRRRRAGRHPG